MEEDEGVDPMMSVSNIVESGFRFEHNELHRLISRSSRASLKLAWRLAATLKDDELWKRSETDQSTYLHHIVNQVNHPLMDFQRRI